MQLIYTCRVIALSFSGGDFQNKSAVTPSIFYATGISCDESPRGDEQWQVSLCVWGIPEAVTYLRSVSRRLLMNSCSHWNVTDSLHGWMRGWISNSRDLDGAIMYVVIFSLSVCVSRHHSATVAHRLHAAGCRDHAGHVRLGPSHR